MRRRYIVHPGLAKGHDGKLAPVTGLELIELYGVPKGDCFIVVSEEACRGLFDGPEYVHLHPRDDGDYSLEEGEQREQYG